MPETQVNLMFRAFSDRTRLRILHLLLDGELCVGDLVNVLRVPQPTASRHLAYLRRAGLVATRKNGQWNYYKLAKATEHSTNICLNASKVVFTRSRKSARTPRKITKLKRSGGCCPR